VLAVSYLRPWSFICGSISVFRFTGYGPPIVTALKSEVSESKHAVVEKGAELNGKD